MRPLAAALAATLLGACMQEDFGEIIVEVDADETVVAHLRTVDIAIYDGDRRVDGTEKLAPTNERPSCVPFSIGVVPEGDFAELELGIVVTAELKTGPTIRRRIDTRFAPGTRFYQIVLERSCLQGCDSTGELEPPDPVDRDVLRADLARKECKQLIEPRECLNLGGCFAQIIPGAPVCRLPCDALPYEPDSPDLPHPPEAPIPPDQSSCPNGWTSCEPWRFGGHRTCPSGQAWFPGESDCASLSECASGEFPAAADPAIYVRAGVTGGGDGSIDNPFGTIAEALGDMRRDSAIVLGAGEHDTSPLVLDRRLRIIGACAERTRIINRRNDRVPIFSVNAEVTLEALSISGVQEAIYTGAGGRLSLNGVELSSIAASALVVDEGASAALQRVRTATTGAGLIVEGGGTLTATAVEVWGSRGVALRVGGASSRAELTQATIASIARVEGNGYAIHALAGAVVTAQETILEDARAHGVMIEGDGTRAHFAELIIRDVEPASDGTRGEGLRISGGASARVERGWISQVRAAGVHASDRANLDLSDLSIRDVGRQGGGAVGIGDGLICADCSAHLARVSIENTFHRGLSISGGAEVVIENLTVLATRESAEEGNGVVVGGGARAGVFGARIEGSEGTGVFVEDGSLFLEDATIADSAGSGIFVRSGNYLALGRAVLRNNRGAGISLATSTSTRTTARLWDVEAISNQPTSDRALNGAGIDAGDSPLLEQPAHRPLIVTINRARAIANHTYGIAIASADATLEDIVASETIVSPANDVTAFGIVITESNVQGRRIAVDHNVDAGVVVTGANTEALFEDIRITNTARVDDADFCGAWRGGGLAVGYQAHAKLTGFLLDRNALTGMFNFDSRGELENGMVSNHLTGITVRSGGFDLQRVGLNVLFDNNMQNVLFEPPPEN